MQALPLQVPREAGEVLMPCFPIRMPDGVGGFICTPRARRVRCGEPGCAQWRERLCDYPKGRKTCSARLCVRHATSCGDDRDLCPKHARQVAAGICVLVAWLDEIAARIRVGGRW